MEIPKFRPKDLRIFLWATAIVLMAACAPISSDETSPNIIVLDVPTAEATEALTEQVQIVPELGVEVQNFNEDEQKIFDQITEYYDKANVPYPEFRRQYFLNQDLKEGETAVDKGFVSVVNMGPQLDGAWETLQAIQELGGDNATKLVWVVERVDYYGGSADPGSKTITLSPSSLKGDRGWRETVGVHELTHLIDLAEKVFDRKTMLELELIKTKLLFDNGGPLVVYSESYLNPYDTGYMELNPLKTIGYDFKDILNDVLPKDHPASQEILKSFGEWSSDGLSDYDEIRLGSMLIIARAENTDFRFTTQEAEDLFASDYYRLVVESFAGQAGHAINGSGNNFEVGPNGASNLEGLRQYYSLARGEEIPDIIEFKNNLRYGNPDPVKFESINK